MGDNFEHYIDIRICYNSTIPVGALSWWTVEKKKGVLVVNPELAKTKLDRLLISVQSMIELAEQAQIVAHKYKCKPNCMPGCTIDCFKEMKPEYKLTQIGKN